MDELDVVGSVMTIGPSVIMGLTCLYLRQAITANLCFHAFMLFAILTSGWSLSGPKNRILHREGSFAELPMPQEKHRARRYGFAMFSVGVSLYFVCRFLSAPGEYLGVNRLELRQTELSLMDELLHTELWSVSACELRQTVLYMTELLQNELWIVSACEHVMRLGVGGGGGAGGGGGRMFRVLC